MDWQGVRMLINIKKITTYIARKHSMCRFSITLLVNETQAQIYKYKWFLKLLLCITVSLWSFNENFVQNLDEPTGPELSCLLGFAFVASLALSALFLAQGLPCLKCFQNHGMGGSIRFRCVLLLEGIPDISLQGRNNPSQDLRLSSRSERVHRLFAGGVMWSRLFRQGGLGSLWTCMLAIFTKFLMFSPEEPPAASGPVKVQSVDDFVPDERLDRSFLEDSLPSKSKRPPPTSAPAMDSDRSGLCACVFVCERALAGFPLSECVFCGSDGEGRGNPMVSGFLDELDPDDNEPTQPRASKPPPSKHVTLTSDEEGGEEAAPIITQDQDVDSEPELKVYVSLNNSMKQSF